MVHPAKMSLALAFRIMEHLKEVGLLKETDTILDPMNGIATTGIAAGALGHKYIGIELEEKFIEMSQKNKQYAESRLFKPLDWTLIKGDSRNLSELLKEQGLVTITSPPYSDGYSIREGGQVNEEYVEKRKQVLREQGKGELVDSLKVLEYSSSNPDNIGNLPDKPLKTVMSPPYDNARNTSQEYDDKYDLKRPVGVAWGRESFRGRYGETEGQIGQEKAESYLEAMLTIYRELYKVSDVLCVVVKNPTRNGQLRRLDLDTIKILDIAGWRVHCQHRALLFEELEQTDMFAGSKKKVKGRLSFFKRLSWQKGQPVASWEDIIICVRQGNLRAIC